jgi:hypothetical protein
MQPEQTLSQKIDKAMQLFERGIQTPVETWGRICDDFTRTDRIAEEKEYAVKREPQRSDASPRLLRQEMGEAGFLLVEKCAGFELPIDVAALREIVAMLDVPSKDRTWLDDCSRHHSQPVRDFAVWYREQLLTRPDSNISRIRLTSDLQPGTRLRITGLRSYATFHESSVSDHRPLTDVGTFVGFASWHPYLHESAFVVLDQEIISARECHSDDEIDDRPIAQFPVKHLMMYGRQFINGFCTLGEKWSSAAEMSMTVEAHANFPTSYAEMHRRRGRYMLWGGVNPHPLPIDRDYCSAADAPIYLALNANYQVIEDPSFPRSAEIVSTSTELHQALDALSIAPSFNGALTAIQRLLESKPSLILIAYPNLLLRLFDQSNFEANEAIREVLTKIGPPALPRLICTLKAACHYLYRWDPGLVGVIAGVLGSFGAEAVETVPTLKNLIAQMPTVRDEIKTALVLIDPNAQ